MIWHFSDGTVAHLGGKIEGDTEFAEDLRLAVKGGPQFPLGPIPSGGRPLDLNNPSEFDWLVRMEMDRPCNTWMMVSLVSAPEVEPLPEFDGGEEGYDGNSLY